MMKGQMMQPTPEMLAMVPEKYSADYIKRRVEETGATELLHHDCGLCRHWVRYLFREDGVFFDSSCNCGWSPESPRTYADIADWLAMQRSDEQRDKIMMGLRPPERTGQ